MFPQVKPSPGTPQFTSPEHEKQYWLFAQWCNISGDLSGRNGRRDAGLVNPEHMDRLLTVQSLFRPSQQLSIDRYGKIIAGPWGHLAEDLVSKPGPKRDDADKTCQKEWYERIPAEHLWDINPIVLDNADGPAEIGWYNFWLPHSNEGREDDADSAKVWNSFKLAAM